MIKKVMLADYTSSNATYPFTLAAHYAETGETGVLGAKMERVVVRAAAVVCARCGYSELYATDLVALESLAADRQSGVRRIRG